MAIVPVITKARVRFGTTYQATETDYSVEIVAGKSIAIYKNGVLARMFALGDSAEYDSYNLSYYGPILSISDKCVVVQENRSKKKHFMDLNKFCWRNWDFDAGVAATKNSDTMQYI